MGIIDIQQPAPYDIVGLEILVAGQSLTFEGNVQWRLTEGHDELTGFITNSGVSVTQFQFSITGVDATAMKLPRLFLNVFEEDVSDGEGNPPPSVTVPVSTGRCSSTTSRAGSRAPCGRATHSRRSPTRSTETPAHSASSSRPIR